MKKLMMVVMMMAGVAGSAAPVVSDVQCKQRYPWNGKVDVTFTVTGVTDGEKTKDQAENKISRFVMVSSNFVNGVAERALEMKTFTEVDGTKANLANIAVTNGTYHYVWDAAADLTAAADKVRHGAVKSYVATERRDKVRGVQLWAGGPYWAECNLGAEKPEDPGYYFWWGDTVGYKRDGGDSKWIRSDGTSDASFAFSSANSAIVTYGKTNQELFDMGYTTDATSGVLNPAHDAARVHTDGAWRMPTKEELSALFSKCNYNVYASLNGVVGCKFTGKEAGYTDKWIFLPAVGCGYGTSLDDLGSLGVYWSSTARAGYSNNAWELYLNYYVCDDDNWTVYSTSRYDGLCVRPVAGFAE